MSGPARLILVRHAEPDESVRNRVYGRLDVELSPGGREHATRLGGMLAAVQLAAVYSSPLRRALATARPIAEGRGREVHVVADLRELDFGELEGLALADVERRFPALLSWTEAPAAVAFPGGESVAALRERAWRATREIVASHAGETVAVVTHAVVIRGILADALELPPDALFRLDQRFGGISVIDWFGERPFVRVVNTDSIGAELPSFL